jgi:polyphenol oxidase
LVDIRPKITTHRPTTIRAVDLPAPFEPVGEHIGIALRGGRALFTTRRGGMSAGPYESLNLGRWTDDDPDAVDRNRHRLAETIGVPLDAVVQGRQTHGTRVARVATGPDHIEEADGQATATRGLAPLVLAADCLPITLIGEGGVAMVHAGWRGLSGGVVEEGMRAMREIGVRDVVAAIGPGAGGCCYEVGDEVRRAFGTSGRTVDLKAIARARLGAAGVAEVHDVGLCTLCSDPALFFSHRRDGGITGRQAGVAWRS